MTTSNAASISLLQSLSGSAGDSAIVAGYYTPGDQGGGEFYLETVLTVSGATNASPIVITTSSAHGYATGQSVVIASVGGNTAANGTWTVTVVSATTFSLNGSTGNASYTSGGSACTFPQVTGASGVSLNITGATNASPISITTSAAHGYVTGQSVAITGVGGNTAANGTWTITQTSATTFTLLGSTGNGAYTSGGTANTVTITTSVAHGLTSGFRVAIGGVGGNTVVNGTWTATVLSSTTFSIGVVTGGAFTSGGAIGDGGTAVPSNSVTGRWRRIFSEALNVKWFGAYGNDANDDSNAIQAAIDLALKAGYGEVLFPHGVYRISRTLQVANGTFCGCTLRGIGGYNYGGSTLLQGAAIRAMHSDSPAINIQGGRGSAVRGIGLIGQLYNWIFTRSLGIFNQTTNHDTSSSDWDDPSLASTADSRYAPYAAVSIDGWAGSQPTTHYPTTYLAYGQPFSSDTLIEDCHIIGFSVAVVNQPCDADGNGDFTCIRRCNIEYCKWGISLGNTQARNTAVTDVKGGVMFCAFATNQHGRQNGKFGSVIKDFSAGQIIQLFQFSTSSYYGPLTMQNCYVEGIWRLGDVTHSTSGESGIEFISCQLYFGSQTDWRGIPASILGGANTTANIAFRNCIFTGYRSTFYCDQAEVVFDGTHLIPAVAPTKSYMAAFNNVTCGGAIMRYLRTNSAQRINFLQYNIDTVVAGQSTMACNGMTGTARANCLPGWIAYGSTSNTGFGGYHDSYYCPRNASVLNKSSFSSVTFTQDATEVGKLTLVWTSLPDYVAGLSGFEPGDVIWDDVTGTTFAIRSRTTTTVIAEVLNNYRYTGSVWASLTAFSTSTGNLYFLNSRIYAPTYPVIVDMDAGAGISVLTGSTTYDPPSLVDGGGDTKTLTVTGAALGDAVDTVAFDKDLQGITVTAYVSAADTVAVRFQNESGGTLDLASGTLRVRVLKASGSSSVLTNAGRDDGYAGFLSDITAGDRVYIDAYTDRWISTANSAVNSVDTSLATITMAGAVSRTQTRKRLQWFARLPPANSSTR